MASAGPNSPGTAVNDTSVGAQAWSNPGNAVSSNNSYASAAATIGTYTTNYLKATNFGFAVPSGATINGVTVSVERKATNNEGSLLYARDSVLKLVKGGAVSGDNKAATTTNWPTSDASASYGGAADLWGLTLTDSDVNASDFGCVISATYKGAPMKSFCSPYVDHITITVTYTESGGGASAVPVIAHSYRQRRA